ncbi:MAG TPA: hypothetical protein VF283_20545 [Bryobacteraceae bacterium]
MRGVLSSREASFDQILIVESCAREVTERFLRHAYKEQRSRRVDLVTCYAGAPRAFDPARGTVFCVHQPEIAGNRRKFISGLNSSPYTLVAIFCAGTPVLQKWKWAIALRTRAKVLIVNERADFFCFDLASRRLAGRLLAERLSLRGSIDLRALAEALLLPFTIAFLLSYAGWVHARRFVRSATSQL